MSLLFALITILLGLAGLIWGADKFVYGASTTARNLGVSPFLIGLTIVAFGTSAPEIFTSTAAALKGAPALALGNALGSNIANIGLVLGITALVCPIMIPRLALKQELPALMLLTIVCFFLLQDLVLDYRDAIVLLLILLLFTILTLRNRQEHDSSDEVADYIGNISTLKSLGWMLLGLGLMLVSANVLVNAARTIALELGVSELMIGLTIVAIGTSLPELATTIAGVLRNHHDLVIGNIIGSNIFNLLLVLPVPALLAPFDIAPVVIWRDYATMLLFTCLLALIMAMAGRWPGRGAARTSNSAIGRVSGSVLLLLYFAYTAFLITTRL